MTRVRFAPSPTGFLHVGGARTALFNWLFARHTGGAFVLRIEDTDRERSTEANTQVILDGLTWLGITWDEGPFFQGANGDRHRADAFRLLAEGKAYQCFCTVERLQEARAEAAARGTAFSYDGKCRGLSDREVTRRVEDGEASVIRLRMPDTEIAWDDLVHGRISFHGRDLDDIVILRSDRSPIYNLAVVSDDIDMGITHVIRGDDHISNTPKQIALYQALGVTPPVFAHVPMIHGTDGKKLSKRHGATAIGDYRHRGILPEAMRNFLALLGWSTGDDTEIMTEVELIERFTLEMIQAKAAVFDVAKLEWMNGEYITATPSELLDPMVREVLSALGVVSDRPLVPIIDLLKSRSRTINQLAERVAVRLDPGRAELDAKGKALRQKLGDAWQPNLAAVRVALEALPADAWTPDALLLALTAVAERLQVKLGDVMQPVRVAMTGSTVSEPVNELLVAVGREQSLACLGRAETI